MSYCKCGHPILVLGGGTYCQKCLDDLFNRFLAVDIPSDVTTTDEYEEIPMPVVKRQTPGDNNDASKTLRQSSLFDRIKPVDDMVLGAIKLSVYGRSKTGKTRLASTFPKPVLIAGTEDGTKSVRGVVGVDFVRILKGEDITDLLDVVREHGYETVVLDTAGGLQDLVLKEVLGLDILPVQRTYGMANREHWMACGSKMKDLLNPLLKLAEGERPVNVVIIAHERNFTDESNSDVMLPSVGSALTPTVAGWLNGECDYICQTFIREGVEYKTTLINGKPMTTKKTTDKKEYCLRVGPHPVYITGFRLPPGVTLPDSIINPTYEKIAALIKGEGVVKKDQ